MSPLSPPTLRTAMRALTAFATLTACSLAYAHPNIFEDSVPRALLSILGVQNQNPVYKIVNCAQQLGLTKCLGALSVWRADRALESFSHDRRYPSNLTADVEQFPWEKYANSSQEFIYSQLCDGTENLLRYRKLSLKMFPGYKLELDSKADGKLNVDVFKDNAIESARGSMKKKFYNIIPLLLIPGLIMSAILPFVLPAMKMATMGAVMINNMALMGAIFSLLRDNAFNDYRGPKIKYINAGYRNEEEVYHSHYPQDHGDTGYSEGQGHDVSYPGYGEIEGEISPDWLKQHNGEFEYVKIGPHRKKY